MPSRRSVTVLAALAVAAPAVAEAQKKPKPNQGPVSVAASPNPTTFSTPVAITGDVNGARDGVLVTLQRRPATGGAFTNITTARTDVAGKYRFSNRPAVNSYYRAVASTSPQQQSGELLVRVRTLVGFRVSDTTPRAGARVRFSGIVRPPHNGRAAAIQRLTTTGRWVTVARPVLRALDARSSRYSRTLRVRQSASYRVRVIGHADHALGTSRTRTLTVR